MSEFETLLGRMPTRDEVMWKNMYVWGLQPHLARTVALKYPTMIAQAAGHAEETGWPSKPLNDLHWADKEHAPLL